MYYLNVLLYYINININNNNTNIFLNKKYKYIIY